MFALYKQNTLAYFRTPIGYTFMSVFLALSGFIFALYNLHNLTGDILSWLSQLTLLLMLLCPLLTMRLLSEERQRKTETLLFTSPLSLTQIVLAKYFSAVSVLLFTILGMQSYILLIVLYGTVYPSEWVVGFLGFLLQGMSFLALDMLVSSFAKNQITGAVFAFGANFLLWMADMLAPVAGGGLGKIIEFFSLYSRYEPFILGQLRLSSVFFFIVFIVICLTLTIRSLDARRFRIGGGA